MKKKSEHKNRIVSFIRIPAAMMGFMMLHNGCAADQNRDFFKAPALQKIHKRGVLRAGTTGDYRPLSFLDPATGRYVGFDAELAKDLADDLGVEIEFVPTSWPALMNDVYADRFDLAICGININEERKEKALMSSGYLKNGKTILCRAEDVKEYADLDSLNRKDVRVMVNPGGTNEQFARENLTKAALIIHDVNQQIPARIAEGKADIMITETVEAGYYASHDERLAAPLIHEPFTHGEIGILMPKGSEDLLEYVNEFLLKEKKTGRIDELAEKHFIRYAEPDDVYAHKKSEQGTDQYLQRIKK